MRGTVSMTKRLCHPRHPLSCGGSFADDCFDSISPTSAHTHDQNQSCSAMSCETHPTCDPIATLRKQITISSGSHIDLELLAASSRSLTRPALTRAFSEVSPAGMRNVSILVAPCVYRRKTLGAASPSSTPMTITITPVKAINEY